MYVSLIVYVYIFSIYEYGCLNQSVCLSVCESVWVHMHVPFFEEKNIRCFSQVLDISRNIPQFLGLFRCFSTFHPISHYFSDSLVASRHFSQYLIFFGQSLHYFRHFTLILIIISCVLVGSRQIS